jgi:uncharacterized protein
MKIPEKVKKLFDKINLVPFGTVDKNGNPNINVVFWKKILDDDTIIFLDNFMSMTKKNLTESKKVCVSFWDPATEEGYKVKGTGTYHTAGNIFEEGKKFIQSKNPNRIPKGVVEIKVQEIFVLTPGPDAGKQLLLK